MLVGLAEEARHEASLGDSILRRVYGFEAQKWTALLARLLRARIEP